MARRTAPLLPATSHLIEELGERIRLARRRRRLLAKQVAQRAGMTLMTLRAIERGAAGATIGAYAAVLQALQLERGLALVAADDPLGRQLQDKALEGTLKPRRTRVSTGHGTASFSPSPAASEPPAGGKAGGISSDDLLALLQPPRKRRRKA